MRGNEASRTRTEQQAGPRRKNRQAARQRLGGGQTEERGEVLWDTEEREPDLPRGWRTGIACEPLGIREAIMSTLGPRKDHRGSGRGSGGGIFEPHLDALVTQELHHCAAMYATRPIAPEQRVRANLEGMRASHSPGAGVWRLARAIDTARASDRGGSPRSWPHRRCAGSPRAPGGVPGARAPCLRDSAPCRLAGGQMLEAFVAETGVALA
jgi:hypothetical protein